MNQREKLGKLGLKLELVQSEQSGTRHYKDENGHRLILFHDGSFLIEEYAGTLP